MNANHPKHTDNPLSLTRRAPGFSLIELLIVIVIIALVIGIVIPSVGAARSAAKKTATQSLCTNISQAMSQFKLDNRRMPGYFSLRDMGGPLNQIAGMSAMENVMLDLAGGIVDPTAPPGNNVLVGPSTNATLQVTVDLDKVGKASGGKAYFTPTNMNFVAQNRQSQNGTATLQGNASDIPNKSMPDLVDAFGSPILLWLEDEAGSDEVKFDTGNSGAHNFCRADSSGAAARFYYNANYCFLNSQALGRKLMDQRDPIKGSILAPSSAGQPAGPVQLDNLTAFLGNPSYPQPSTMAAGFNVRNVLPADGRGDYIIHSAGADGVYAGRRDKGASQGENVSADARIYYGLNFKNLAGVGYSDAAGKSTTSDIASAFDDIFLSGGG